MEVIHLAFNPRAIFLYHSPLQAICDKYQEAGWELVRIIPHHEYESVAVFMREFTEDPYEKVKRNS